MGSMGEAQTETPILLRSCRSTSEQAYTTFGTLSGNQVVGLMISEKDRTLMSHVVGGEVNVVRRNSRIPRGRSQ